MSDEHKRTFGEVLADRNSNLARTVRHAQRVMARNEKVIAQLEAQGLTREQAWAKALRQS